MKNEELEYVCITPTTWGKGEDEAEALDNALVGVSKFARVNDLSFYRVKKGGWSITDFGIQFARGEGLGKLFLANQDIKRLLSDKVAELTEQKAKIYMLLGQVEKSDELLIQASDILIDGIE